MTASVATLTYINARTGSTLASDHVDKDPQSMPADGLGRAWVGTTACRFAAAPAYDALHRPVSAAVVAPTGEWATVAQRTDLVDSTSAQFNPALNPWEEIGVNPGRAVAQIPKLMVESSSNICHKNSINNY